MTAKGEDGWVEVDCLVADAIVQSPGVVVYVASDAEDGTPKFTEWGTDKSSTRWKVEKPALREWNSAPGERCRHEVPGRCTDAPDPS